jgi:hypothetical protein
MVDGALDGLEQCTGIEGQLRSFTRNFVGHVGSVVGVHTHELASTDQRVAELIPQLLAGNQGLCFAFIPAAPFLVNSDPVSTDLDFESAP